jgi:hypothetical protein
MPSHPAQGPELPFPPDELSLGSSLAFRAEWGEAYLDRLPARERRTAAPAADALPAAGDVVRAGGMITSTWVDEFGAAGFTGVLSVRQAFEVDLLDEEAITGFCVSTEVARRVPHLVGVWASDEGMAAAARLYRDRVRALRAEYADEQRALAAAHATVALYGRGAEPPRKGFVRRRPR